MTADLPLGRNAASASHGKTRWLHLPVLAKPHAVFLLLKIPEEHDLESQIRKEREWRFLRNTRVRQQARQLIQKGKPPGAGGDRASAGAGGVRVGCGLPSRNSGVVGG